MEGDATSRGVRSGDQETLPSWPLEELSPFWRVRQSTPAFSYVPAFVPGAPGRLRARWPGRFTALGVLALAVASFTGPRALLAQRYTRPERNWTTYESAHFRFHAPRDLAPWARTLAEHMEAVRRAEQAVVGVVPAGVTDVVVDDPLSASNGSAYPYRDTPAIFLWPVPPDPRSMVGNGRSWGELLVVHEFAHIAHLTRGSRNPRQRLLRALLPGRVGPLATRTTRWIWEGYATYVEGVLTGAGRPHAALRAAVVRRWALDGALPSYGGLNGTGGYLGGSFPYVVGSAYLEWLGARRGDSSVTALWRRLSARVDRPFGTAFGGVYGDGPATLYGRFVADLTVEAATDRARLDSAGLVEGTLVQRLMRGIGDPAVRADGQRIAVEVANKESPSRVVVWRAGVAATRDTAPDSAFARAQRRALRRDPEDVAAIRAYPLPRTATATLEAVNGRSHHDPRWFSRWAANPRLARRVDRRRGVPPGSLRLGHGVGRASAGLRPGQRCETRIPPPTGRTAAAVRCLAGRCDLARVDLATGAVRTLAAGSFARTWTRPRWAPDGRRLVAPVQEDGRWRLALVNAETGAFTLVTPDDGANRYDAAFTPDGMSLVYTSEAGGIPNVVRLSLPADRRAIDVTAAPASAPAVPTEQPLTRVTGAAFAPAPSGAAGAVYFLDLTPHGLDLRQVAPDSTPVRGAIVDLTSPAALLPRTTGEAVRSAVAPSPAGPGRQLCHQPSPRALLRHRPRATLSGSRSGVARPMGLPAARSSPASTPSAGSPGCCKGSRATLVSGTARRFARVGEVPSRRSRASCSPPGRTSAPGADCRGVFPSAPTSRSMLGRRRRRSSRRATAGRSAKVAARRTCISRAASASSRDGCGSRRARAGASSGVGRARTRAPSPPPRPPSHTPRAAPSRWSTRGSAWVGRATSAARTARSPPTPARGTPTEPAGDGAPSLPHWARMASGSASGWTGSMASPTTRRRPSSSSPSAELYPGSSTPRSCRKRFTLPALPTGYRAGRQAMTARLSLTGGTFTPYYATVDAGEHLGSWTRLAGVETRTTIPFAPFARAALTRVIAGGARIFDGPLHDRTRFYFSLAFSP